MYYDESLEFCLQEILIIMVAKVMGQGLTQWQGVITWVNTGGRISSIHVQTPTDISSAETIVHCTNPTNSPNDIEVIYTVSVIDIESQELISIGISKARFNGDSFINGSYFFHFLDGSSTHGSIVPFRE
jgi:hypothetical protein